MMLGKWTEFINVAVMKYIVEIAISFMLYQGIISKMLMTNSDDRNAWKVHTPMHCCSARVLPSRWLIFKISLLQIFLSRYLCIRKFLSANLRIFSIFHILQVQNLYTYTLHILVLAIVLCILDCIVSVFMTQRSIKNMRKIQNSIEYACMEIWGWI